MAWLTKKTRMFDGKQYNLVTETSGKPMFAQTKMTATRVAEIMRNRGSLARIYNDPEDGWLVYIRNKK